MKQILLLGLLGFFWHTPPAAADTDWTRNPDGTYTRIINEGARECNAHFEDANNRTLVIVLRDRYDDGAILDQLTATGRERNYYSQTVIWNIELFDRSCGFPLGISVSPMGPGTW